MVLRFSLSVLATLLLVQLSGCASSNVNQPPTVAKPAASEPPFEQPPERQREVVDNSTAGVAQRHFKQLEEGNIEGLLDNYDESAIVLLPRGLVQGKEQLVEHLSNLAKEFSEDASNLTLGDLRVRDEMAYITWSADTANNKYQMGTNTFVVANGKIVAQSFAGNVVPKGESEASETNEEDSLQEGKTLEVLNHHLSALETGEFEEVWTDYSRDSLILTQKGKKSGKEGVKGVLELLNVEFKNPKFTIEVAKKIAQGEVAYVLWSAKTESGSEGFITETFVIREGKIASQSLTVGTPKD